MSTTRSAVTVFSAAMMVLGAGAVCGQVTSTGSVQAYPTRPIRIVTGSVGGSNDTAARMIAPAISPLLGQHVIVENRATIVTAETVAKALPDGYTLLLAGDILWIGPLLRDAKARAQQPDPIRDFAPITMLSSAPNLLVVHPTFPAKTVQELIALAKAKPGVLNYGKSTPGGTPHLGGEMLNTMAGVKIVPIPYKGSGDIAAAVVANQLDLGFIGAGSGASLIKAGRLRALAVTSLQPSALFPGLPTVAATIPGFELAGIDAMYAPAKTPAAIVTKINREIVRFIRSPEGREKYLNLGAEVVGSTPAEHAAKIKVDMASVGKLIKDAGITIE